MRAAELFFFFFFFFDDEFFFVYFRANLFFTRSCCSWCSLVLSSHPNLLSTYVTRVMAMVAVGVPGASFLVFSFPFSWLWWVLCSPCRGFGLIALLSRMRPLATNVGLLGGDEPRQRRVGGNEATTSEVGGKKKGANFMIFPNRRFGRWSDASGGRVQAEL